MNDSNIKWYSMTPKLAVEEHDPIGLDEALRLVDRYLARGSEKFQTSGFHDDPVIGRFVDSFTVQKE